MSATGTAPLRRALEPYRGVLALDGDAVVVEDADRLRAAAIDRLVRDAVFGPEDLRDAARRAIRGAAARLGIHPASIHPYYMARGRGTAKGATTPAVNVRTLSYDTARAVFRAAHAIDALAFIFEIARSEIGYTAQRPAEYAAVVLAAAIREGHAGPVFIQGDHFQLNPTKYATDPAGEVEAVRALIRESIAAGFLNLDIDSSTLVDLSQPTIEAQQETNARIAAELTLFARSIEPAGAPISIGGEIGEVGKQNSSPEELRAFMNRYLEVLAERGGAVGLSKISIQTGTSHGGVVLPDGSLAQVAIDFACLKDLGRIARNEYGLGGAVQHGASTLPTECFDRFSKADAVEVHLATNFQNMVFDAPELPSSLREEMYRWLDREAASERKPTDTAEQFYYKARKKALGPFKRRIWDLGEPACAAIGARLEAQFSLLMGQLGIAKTRAPVLAHTRTAELAAMDAAPAAPDDHTLDD